MEGKKIEKIEIINGELKVTFVSVPEVQPVKESVKIEPSQALPVEKPIVVTETQEKTLAIKKELKRLILDLGNQYTPLINGINQKKEEVNKELDALNLKAEKAGKDPTKFDFSNFRNLMFKKEFLKRLSAYGEMDNSDNFYSKFFINSFFDRYGKFSCSEVKKEMDAYMETLYQQVANGMGASFQQKNISEDIAPKKQAQPAKPLTETPSVKIEPSQASPVEKPIVVTETQEKAETAEEVVIVEKLEKDFEEELKEFYEELIAELEKNEGWKEYKDKENFIKTKLNVFMTELIKQRKIDLEDKKEEFIERIINKITNKDSVSLDSSNANTERKNSSEQEKQKLLEEVQNFVDKFNMINWVKNHPDNFSGNFGNLDNIETINNLQEWIKGQIITQFDRSPIGNIECLNWVWFIDIEQAVHQLHKLGANEEIENIKTQLKTKFKENIAYLEEKKSELISIQTIAENNKVEHQENTSKEANQPDYSEFISKFEKMVQSRIDKPHGIREDDHEFQRIAIVNTSELINKLEEEATLKLSEGGSIFIAFESNDKFLVFPSPGICSRSIDEGTYKTLSYIFNIPEKFIKNMFIKVIKPTIMYKNSTKILQKGVIEYNKI